LWFSQVFSRPNKQEVLAGVSNLMIWSDNDVANDFTTMKTPDGAPKYHPHFLGCGMRVYREYQRRLWDPTCSTATPAVVGEWHAHAYGPIGVFMFDLRGNRVTGDGVQMSDNALLSDQQWADVEAFFAKPDLRAIILCSETPFLGDEPAACKDKVSADPVNMAFLKDHWPYNESELLRLLDLCFAWKEDGQRMACSREVLLLGGDIHCGVTSVVLDESTGAQIHHLTASPITNHVCKFFPPLEGRLNRRYSFTHRPLGRKFRNYADVKVDVDASETVMSASLVAVNTDVFKEEEAWRRPESEWFDVEDF